MSDVLHIVGEDQYKTEVSDFEGVVVVDCYADWCGPCKMLGPVMQELHDDYQGKAVKIVKVDVDNSANQPIAAQFGVSSIPAVYFVQNGEVKNGIIGANPKHVYAERIDGFTA